MQQTGFLRTLQELLSGADRSVATLVRRVEAVLAVAGRVVGVLNVYHSEGHQWPSEEVRAGQAYASLIALLSDIAVEPRLQAVEGIHRLSADTGRRSPTALGAHRPSEKRGTGAGRP